MGMAQSIFHPRVNGYRFKVNWRLGEVGAVRGLRLELLEKWVAKAEVRFSGVARQGRWRGTKAMVNVLVETTELGVLH